jgi:hypothetical protein
MNDSNKDEARPGWWRRLSRGPARTSASLGEPIGVREQVTRTNEIGLFQTDCWGEG